MFSLFAVHIFCILAKDGADIAWRTHDRFEPKEVNATEVVEAIHEIKQRLPILEANVAATKAALDPIEAQLQELQPKADELSGRIDPIKEELTDLKSKQEALQSKIKEYARKQADVSASPLSSFGWVGYRSGGYWLMFLQTPVEGSTRIQKHIRWK